MLSMMAFSFILFCSAMYFLISFFFKKDERSYLKLLLFFLDFSLSYFLFVLCTNQSIFYFQAPFVDRFSVIVSLSAYVPNILVLIIIPLIYWNLIVFKTNSWTFIPRNLFLLNNVIYVILLCFLGYWRLFWCWVIAWKKILTVHSINKVWRKKRRKEFTFVMSNFQQVKSMDLKDLNR